MLALLRSSYLILTVALFFLLISCDKPDKSNAVKDYIQQPRKKALESAELGEQRASEFKDKLEEFEE
jgi:hypothetical protein